ncbi:MAG: hypothetical protein M3Q69_01145 [Acidobacteriota bacterium]|nr:hypothetical protein [Acidobacteriota bacterium]
MARPQVSVIKRQREQAKRDRQERKAERRAQRKTDKLNGVETDGVDPDIEVPEEQE